MNLIRADLTHVWRHLLAKGGVVPPFEYQLLVGQTVGGAVSAAIVKGEAPVAIGGVFVPAEGEPGTAWLSLAPGARRSIVGIVLAMRRYLRREASKYPAGVVCVVRCDNERGARLAEMLGFAPSPVMVGELRQWRFAA